MRVSTRLRIYDQNVKKWRQIRKDKLHEEETHEDEKWKESKISIQGIVPKVRDITKKLKDLWLKI